MAGVALLIASATVSAAEVPLVGAGGSPTLHRTGSIQTHPFTGSSTSMGDNEGLAYVPSNDMLWVADDISRQLYAVNRSTGALKQVVTRSQFAAARRLGGTEVAGPTRSFDLEAVAYDQAHDTLYAFSANCCTSSVHPTVFRLKRSGSSSPFVIESWRALTSPYNDLSGAGVRNGEIWAAKGKTIVRYDYVTGATSSSVTLPGSPSSIFGVGFSSDGKDLWIVGSGARLMKYNWSTKQPVSGYAFTTSSLVKDPRAIEVIGSQIYVSDGYDVSSSATTSAYGIRVLTIST
jgi:hypothetical protein